MLARGVAGEVFSCGGPCWPWFGILAAWAAPGRAQGLFAEAPASFSLEAAEGLGVVRSRPVRVQLGRIPGASAREAARGVLPPRGHRLVLNLFDDVVVRARLTRAERQGRALVWAGKIEGQPMGDVVLAVVDGVLTGSAVWPGGAYRIRFDGTTHVVEEIDHSRFPEDGPGFEPYAFSVVELACMTGYYSFGHELGHNMGLNHARADPVGTGAYPYSYGYKNPSNLFRTVMAYNCPVHSRPPLLESERHVRRQPDRDQRAFGELRVQRPQPQQHAGYRRQLAGASDHHARHAERGRDLVGRLDARHHVDLSQPAHGRGREHRLLGRYGPRLHDEPDGRGGNRSRSGEPGLARLDGALQHGQLVAGEAVRPGLVSARARRIRGHRLLVSRQRHERRALLDRSPRSGSRPGC